MIQPHCWKESIEDNKPVLIGCPSKETLLNSISSISFPQFNLRHLHDPIFLLGNVLIRILSALLGYSIQKNILEIHGRKKIYDHWRNIVLDKKHSCHGSVFQFRTRNWKPVRYRLRRKNICHVQNKGSFFRANLCGNGIKVTVIPSRTCQFASDMSCFSCFTSFFIWGILRTRSVISVSGKNGCLQWALGVLETLCAEVCILFLVFFLQRAKPVATCYESFSTRRNMFLNEWPCVGVPWVLSIGSFQMILFSKDIFECWSTGFFFNGSFGCFFGVSVSISDIFFGFKSWSLSPGTALNQNSHGSEATLARTFCQAPWLHYGVGRLWRINFFSSGWTDGIFLLFTNFFENPPSPYEIES